MHNPATAFFTAEDKQRHPYLSSVLEPSTQKVIATAAVRVYYAPFINAQLNWTFSNLRGILVFGRDREAAVPPPDRGIGTHGLRLKEKYWFRLVDIKTDRVVWMFSVPEVFEYNKDKPFFHYFSGTVRSCFAIQRAYVGVDVDARTRAPRPGCLVSVSTTTTKRASFSKKWSTERDVIVRLQRERVSHGRDG